MKKTIFAAMLLLPGLLFAQKDQKIPIDDAGLGKLFPDCIAVGRVCNLFPKEGKAEDANANAIKTRENAFDLEIRRETFSSEKQTAMFGKELSEIRPGETVLFSLEKDLPIDSVFLEAVDIDRKYRIIPAGSYAVEILEEFIIIHLSLTD